MKIKSLSLSIIILVILFGGVAVTSVTGLWKTTNTKIPATIKTGEFAGQNDPADIRGSYTLNDISTNFLIPLEDLGKAFGVKDPAQYADFECKELETLYASLKTDGKEIGTGSVRYFVALYKGIPLAIEADTYLPTSAVEILKAKAKLTEEQIKSIEKISVALPNISSSEPIEATPIAPAPKEGSTTINTIKGSTTFKEVLDWGVKKEEIEKIINDKMPDAGTVVKDYASGKGIEFSSIKEPLQQLVDTTKK